MSRLLPGQQIINGVSNYIFGTNMGQDGTNPTVVRNTPAIQAQVKAANFQIIRFDIPSGKANSWIDETMAAAIACGCQLYGLLSGTNLSWNEYVISYIGSLCNIWEVGNEPNGGSAGYLTGSQYYTQWWAPQILILRGLAQAGSAFIGPTITYRAGALDGSFVTDWLNACVASGNPAMLPDGVSFHHYPCTSFPSQSSAPAATIFASDYSIMDSAVRGVLGYSLPVIISEWNVGGGSPPPAYCDDPTFVTPWVHTAIDTFATSGFAAAMQFEAGTGEGAGGLDLIQSTVAGFPPGPDYQPIWDRNIHYLQTQAVSLVGSGAGSDPESSTACSRDGLVEADSRDGLVMQQVGSRDGVVQGRQVGSRDGLSPEADSRDGLVAPAADTSV